MIDGQQQFFDDLNTNETKAEEKRNSVLMAEFKRLGDKISSEYAGMDRRVSVMEKKVIEDENIVTKAMLDEKLDRIEFENVMGKLQDITLSSLQKQVDKAKRDIECIEVSLGII